VWVIKVVNKVKYKGIKKDMGFWKALGKRVIERC